MPTETFLLPSLDESTDAEQAKADELKAKLMFAQNKMDKAFYTKEGESERERQRAKLEEQQMLRSIKRGNTPAGERRDQLPLPPKNLGALQKNVTVRTKANVDVMFAQQKLDQYNMELMQGRSKKQQLAKLELLKEARRNGTPVPKATNIELPPPVPKATNIELPPVPSNVILPSPQATPRTVQVVIEGGADEPLASPPLPPPAGPPPAVSKVDELRAQVMFAQNKMDIAFATREEEAERERQRAKLEELQLMRSVKRGHTPADQIDVLRTAKSELATPKPFNRSVTKRTTANVQVMFAQQKLDQYNLELAQEAQKQKQLDKLREMKDARRNGTPLSTFGKPSEETFDLDVARAHTPMSRSSAASPAWNSTRAISPTAADTVKKFSTGTLPVTARYGIWAFGLAWCCVIAIAILVHPKGLAANRSLSAGSIATDFMFALMLSFFIWEPLACLFLAKVQNRHTSNCPSLDDDDSNADADYDTQSMTRPVSIMKSSSKPPQYGDFEMQPIVAGVY